jgi:hypothetical protein
VGKAKKLRFGFLLRRTKRVGFVAELEPMHLGEHFSRKDLQVFSPPLGELFVWGGRAG